MDINKGDSKDEESEPLLPDNQRINILVQQRQKLMEQTHHLKARPADSRIPKGENSDDFHQMILNARQKRTMQRGSQEQDGTPNEEDEI